jgi:hypothetical protein
MDRLDALVWTGERTGEVMLASARLNIDKQITAWAERADKVSTYGDGRLMWSAEQLDADVKRIHDAFDHYRDVRTRLEQARRVLR